MTVRQATALDKPVPEAHETAEAIESAALEVFYVKGYHGASIRAIASAADVGISTLFHHFPNKAAILEKILARAVDAMQADIDAAIENVEDPVERLSAAVRALVVAHCERQSQSFVAQSELRSIDPPAEGIIREKRRRVQAVYDDAVEAGIASGAFSCPYPHEAARAIVSMGTMVATWYHEGRGLSPQRVADIYVEMALDLVRADDAVRPDA